MDDRVWKKISDTDVRTTWKCPDCEMEDTVSPDWYQDNGTVVCGNCDRDCDYVKTEILVCRDANITAPQISERSIQLE